jgi:hypothetical protein
VDGRAQAGRENQRPLREAFKCLDCVLNRIGSEAFCAVGAPLVGRGASAKSRAQAWGGGIQATAVCRPLAWWSPEGCWRFNPSGVLHQIHSFSDFNYFWR